MSDLRILSWNVNGLRSMVKKGFVEWLQKDSPDILCIQETKANPNQLTRALKHIEGYYSYFAAAERKGYSGVAIYSKVAPERVEYGFGDPRFDHEGRILIAWYENFVLFNIYYPNGNSSQERLDYKMDFYDAFLEYVDGVRDEGYNVVVCGDVNTAHKEIDLARPKQNEKRSGFLPEERAWIDEFLSHGYIDTFRMFTEEGGHYSWWDMKTRSRDRNVGWRIDYFFVNEEFRDNVKDSFMLSDVMGSDHCPIGITLED
ncbi:exodeoxyribonuclease-3 [Methanohalophilus levihalophilus]|uniref:exodeoxyribonuclease III n=1 Tax=Methanohalophilus levihalophilus TaxID=1431282 RepID=UPI001AE53C9F|nr:exodeoxyribonuclease III [Methanohalophilus levihalophilus]MBP2030208.1 exodeoxyribonuclease-3 [Methanohalophilus levihalophilus]